MRIALFVPWFGSPSATFVVRHVAGLTDAGHEVRIFTRGIDADHAVHDAVARCGMLDFVTVVPVGPAMAHHRIRAVFACLLKLFCRSPRLAVAAINPFRHGLRDFDFSILFDTSFASYGRFDAVLCHFADAGRHAAAMRRVGALQGPIATIFHGVDVNDLARQPHAPGRRILLSEGDLFLPVSNYFAGILRGLGCDWRRILVHRMGVCTGQFRFTPRRLEPGGTARLVSVSRLVEKKGLVYAIEAVAMLRDRGTVLDYRIIGDGPLRDDLQRRIDELGVADCVHIEGWLPHRQVEQVLAAAHVFVSPSVTAEDGNTEGVPVALMEAMAVGLPVLATEHAGVPELVHDPTTGRCVPERNAEALAAGLSDLLARADDFEAMGRAGREVVLKQFNADTLGAELERLLFELAGILPSVEARPEADVVPVGQAAREHGVTVVRT